jgi:hypothetical protein
MDKRELVRLAALAVVVVALLGLTVKAAVVTVAVELYRRA